MTVKELTDWSPYICCFLGTFRVMRRSSTDFIAVSACRDGSISYEYFSRMGFKAVWSGSDVPESVGDTDENVWYMEDRDLCTLKRDKEVFNQIVESLEEDSK